MKTPLAWKNLVHSKMRTAVALAGVSFAVILIFMQLGFKGAARKTATQIYDALDFDLMLRSPAYLHLTEPHSFPRERVYQAASLPEVATARMFNLGLTQWQAPEPADGTPGEWAGDWRGIIAIGVDRDRPPFFPDDLRRKSAQLTDARFILIDSKSKPEFGPKDGVRFSSEDIGVETVLGGGRVKIVDVVELGTGLAATGACIMNFEGFARACPWQPLDEVSFGLLKLKAGIDPIAAKQRVQALLGAPATSSTPSSIPADTEVLTRAEVNEREEYRWVVQTPIGKIFNFGVWVAMFVGVAIVYQVLSTHIANMMGEYATLKAMGYRNRYLTTVVLQHSVLLAVAGYVPSLVVSWALYRFIGTRAHLPMIMTWQIAVSVAFLAVLMCIVSGLAALRKLFEADPADLY